MAVHWPYAVSHQPSARSRLLRDSRRAPGRTVCRTLIPIHRVAARAGVSEIICRVRHLLLTAGTGRLQHRLARGPHVASELLKISLLRRNRLAVLTEAAASQHEIHSVGQGNSGVLDDFPPCIGVGVRVSRRPAGVAALLLRRRWVVLLDVEDQIRIWKIN